MARTRRKRMAQSGTLDSFLDIVTNSLGLLILVSTLTATSSQGIQVRLGTPMMTAADPSLEIREFEIRENRLVPMKLEFAEDAIAEYRNAVSFPGGLFGPPTVDAARTAELNARSVQNDYYRIEFRTDRPGFTLHPVHEEIGEPLSALDDPASEFRTLLGELSPDKHWIYLTVDGDSFEAFATVRKHLRELGFEIGWWPREAGRELSFTFGGGGMAPQPDKY